jgi:hypothetical protein
MTVTAAGVGGHIELLTGLGLAHPEEFADLKARDVERVVADWRRDKTAGEGALVSRLRLLARQSLGVEQEQACSHAYWARIERWVTATFPGLSAEGHEEACLRTWRLHYRFGREAVTVARFGDQIREGLS